MDTVQTRIENVLNSLYHPAFKPIDLSIERVKAFMSRVGNPEQRLPPVIHVAGTNGKGSMIACLKAIFEEAGYSVHRYTSPHLVRFHERIELNGAPIEDDNLLELLLRVQKEAEQYPVTFFEATTAAALLAFAETKADVLLLETGMGGRLDATNVVEKPLLTAITPVAMDHSEFLGDSIAEIAREKAGILKDGVPCVVGRQPKEAYEQIQKQSEKHHSPLICCGEEWKVTPLAESEALYRSSQRELKFRAGLPGAHQLDNAAMAIACCDAMPQWNFTDEQIVNGIAKATWPARLQQLKGGLLHFLPERSELWLDGGHNPDAGAALARWAGDFSDMSFTMVVGMIQDKDAEGFLAPFAAIAERLVAIPVPGEQNSQHPAAIASCAAVAGIPEVDTAETLDEALSILAEDDFPMRVLICGSLYLAGRVLALEKAALSGS